MQDVDAIRIISIKSNIVIRESLPIDCAYARHTDNSILNSEADFLPCMIVPTKYSRALFSFFKVVGVVGCREAVGRPSQGSL
jgi:hypothetical protein